mgnify:FL=1
MQGCKLISISLSLYIYIEISYLYYIQCILTYIYIYIYINEQTIDSNVTAAGIFHLDRPAADEFLEVYQGILADIEYNATTMEMTSGRLLALELTQNNNGGNSKTDDSNVVTNFRNLCGPYPVHIAKKIRSDCLRAQYGTTVAENAVHCTDLQSDGVIECEYFFGILGSSY